MQCMSFLVNQKWYIFYNNLVQMNERPSKKLIIVELSHGFYGSWRMWNGKRLENNWENDVFELLMLFMTLCVYAFFYCLIIIKS